MTENRFRKIYGKLYKDKDNFVGLMENIIKKLDIKIQNMYSIINIQYETT